MADITLKKRRGTGNPPGRRPGYSHLPIVRERIRVGMLVKKLQRHVAGMEDLSPTQIRAAEILLKKTLPDLSAVEHSGEVGTRRPEELSDALLADIVAEGGEDAGEAEQAAKPH